MKSAVSILAEIPEEIHQSLKSYLESHPNWDQDRVFAAALSLFLLQNSGSEAEDSSQNYRACARVYLETLFQQDQLRNQQAVPGRGGGVLTSSFSAPSRRLNVISPQQRGSIC